MSGIEIEGNKIVITNGDRTVASTDGTLLQFLTTEQTYEINIDFPHVNKTILYQFEYTIRRVTSNQASAVRKARSIIGALPQEWSNTVILGPAPTGADLFVGRVALTRTIAPTHTWGGSDIKTLLPSGQYIQATGTFLVEAALGISRSMTIDVQGGNLVARLQHSVGPAAGNFRTSGVWPPAIPSSSISPNNVYTGAENIAVDGEGIPIWWIDEAPYYANEGQGFETPFFPNGPDSWVSQRRYSGSNPVAYTDPTSYLTRYAISVKGRFGRRS